MGDSPLCDLTPVAGNDRALSWRCIDFSDVHTGKSEIYTARFITVDNSENFREKFEAARNFNKLVAEGKLDDLVFAPLYEEPPALGDDEPNPLNDPNINQEPTEQDHIDGFGNDD